MLLAARSSLSLLLAAAALPWLLPLRGLLPLLLARAALAATLALFRLLPVFGQLARLLGTVLLSIPLTAETDGGILAGRRQDPLDSFRLSSDHLEQLTHVDADHALEFLDRLAGENVGRSRRAQALDCA